MAIISTTIVQGRSLHLLNKFLNLDNFLKAITLTKVIPIIYFSNISNYPCFPGKTGNKNHRMPVKSLVSNSSFLGVGYKMDTMTIIYKRRLFGCNMRFIFEGECANFRGHTILLL